MKLKEQLQKIIDDLEKLERKKDKFMEEYEEKKKKIILKKKDLEEKIRKEEKSNFFGKLWNRRIHGKYADAGKDCTEFRYARNCREQFSF